MKNVSFMQLVLGVGGALMIYAGVKDLDLVAFFKALASNPATAFSQGGYFSSAKTTGATPSSNTTPGKTSGDSGVQHI
jgi:hypothetical protein